jgi:putative transposase
VKFRFVQEHRETFRVGKMCEVLKVSRSGFYAWLGRLPNRRIREDEVIAEQVHAVVYRDSRRIYGSPRVYRELKKRGESWGRHRIARIMREEGLQARCMKQFHWISTTRSKYPAAPDLPERKFVAAKRDRVWVGDITQIRTGEGRLYLPMLMDMYSRKIVGWSTSKSPKRDIALEALEMAVEQRRPRSGLIHHTDRGG